MNRALKVGVGAVVVLIVLAVGSVGAIYGVTASRFSRTFEVDPGGVPIPQDSATLAWGEHLVRTRGCTDCHGEDFAGTRFLDAMPMASLAASNLTRGTGGVGGTLRDEDWVRAIRHGVRSDGTSLLAMPSYEYEHLSDEDLGAMISYLKTVPPVDRVHDANQVGPLGRALYLFQSLPLLSAELVDHTPRERTAPPRGATAEYGGYIAKGCTGCHGADFTGGPIPGGDPSWPPAADISRGPDNAMVGWTEADFMRALREGVRPDGSTIDPVMPWRITRLLEDYELKALWLHLGADEAATGTGVEAAPEEGMPEESAPGDVSGDPEGSAPTG